MPKCCLVGEGEGFFFHRLVRTEKIFLQKVLCQCSFSPSARCLLLGWNFSTFLWSTRWLCKKNSFMAFVSFLSVPEGDFQLRCTRIGTPTLQKLGCMGSILHQLGFVSKRQIIGADKSQHNTLYRGYNGAIERGRGKVLDRVPMAHYTDRACCRHSSYFPVAFSGSRPDAAHPVIATHPVAI